MNSDPVAATSLSKPPESQKYPPLLIKPSDQCVGTTETERQWKGCLLPLFQVNCSFHT